MLVDRECVAYALFAGAVVVPIAAGFLLSGPEITGHERITGTVVSAAARQLVEGAAAESIAKAASMFLIFGRVAGARTRLALVGHRRFTIVESKPDLGIACERRCRN